MLLIFVRGLKGNCSVQIILFQLWIPVEYEVTFDCMHEAEKHLPQVAIPQQLHMLEHVSTLRK